MESASLAEYFHFNETDLQANRNGWISNRQKASLARQGLPEKAPGVGCALGFFAIASIFPIAWYPVMRSGEISTGELLGIGFAVAVWVLVWGAIGVGIVISSFASAELTLDFVEGAVVIEKVNRPKGKSGFRLRVGERKFSVADDLSAYLEPERKYTVYYVKEEEKILSLEPAGELQV